MKKFLKVYRKKLPARFFEPNSEDLKTVERNLLNLNSHIVRLSLNKVALPYKHIKSSYNALLRCVYDSG